MRGERIYGAIGGAAELTDMGVHILEDRFQAKMEKGNDARFLVQMRHFTEVMDLFSNRDPQFCETDPVREIQEELTTIELPGMPPILTVEEAADIQIRYVKSLHQAGETDSPRASAQPDENPFSYRYFHLFEMIVPKTIFRSLYVHPAIRLFTSEEVATTRMGLVRGQSTDGRIIATNLFW
ncbi:hypothetical protein HYV70_02860 [Candidatus Uhrbacteria bacterium]|nr:hypothetical protein [Candidatus Uhrbacteria bacterium]